MKSTTATATKSQAKRETDAKNISIITANSSCNAAAVVAEYGKPFGDQDLNALIEELSASIKRVNEGDLKRCEGMLMGQAHALQSMFVNFSRRALKQEYQANLESFFRMALKAQSQCRATLETLAAIKNPPIVYAKQANVTTGPQQINNGTLISSRPQENEIEPTQLSGENSNVLPTDTRAAQAASRIDSPLETLGEIDRAKVRGRKGAVCQAGI